ncbi:MAG TPA: serine/threonine-protein kinase, partial [Solirubrobacteraceae bacterium]|nr:serine/threonine-protein kinase [Solirubrobacteraceae bacterium]
MSVGATVELPPRYRDPRHLANGGMAAVYAAEDDVLGRRVAVKVLAAHFAEDPAAVHRFQREARAAARVSQHPHVVTIYDVGEHAGRPFIVMELRVGGSLAQVLREGVPPRADALRWVAEAGSALDAAHALDIVHRDVKPGN